MTSRSWVFTINNYTDDDLTAIAHIDLHCRYCIVGFEEGEQGTPHIQGYIEFSQAKRKGATCKLLGGRAYVAARRGTREEARNYCLKDGIYEECGSWEAGGQGTRTDLTSVMASIKDGTKMLHLMEEAPECVSRHMRFVEKYVALQEKEATKEFRQVDVEVLHGDAGTGKTRSVHDRCPDVFTVNSGESFPFEGYDGEEAILLDDFYGGIRYHELLRVLDGHQYRVNVKGGHRYAQWTKVYITSNVEPSQWYTLGLTAALSRRLTTVTELRHEVAGNNEAATIPLDDNIL